MTPNQTAAEPDKDALEHEIEQTREDLVQTVDAIVDRVDPQRVADRTQEQVRRTTQRTAARAQDRIGDLIEQGRDYADREPMKAGAIAGAAVAGLAWVVWDAVRPTGQQQQQRQR